MADQGFRWFAMLVGVAASALVICACGGPTDASVIARGNAICEQALAAIRVEPASVAGVSAAAAVVGKEVRGLTALPRPAEHLKVLEQFIGAERTVSREYAALAVAERRGDSAAEAHAETGLATAASVAARSAQSYGISRCAAAGSTVGSG